MKLKKYLMFAGAALLLTACSNDDWNTSSGVTVQMEYATMSVKENVGTFYVPLKLEGKTNGPVRVDVQVAEYSANPAIADVHYYMTSSSVTFPTDSATVGIEFVAVNDMEINEDRLFTVTITHVEGGSIGSQATTDVTIRDDDAMFYEAVQGAWKFTGLGFFDDSKVSNDISIVGVDEDNSLYEQTLYLSGWGGQASLKIEGEYSYDMATNEISIFVPFGQTMGQLNFTGLGLCDVVLFGVSGDYLVDEGGAYLTVNPNMREITFNPAEVFFYGVVAEGEYMGGWNGVYEMNMTR